MHSMEIPEHIIEKAFELKSKKSLNSELKKELKKLQALSIEEILFDEKKIKIDSKIRGIHYKLFSYSSEPKLQDVHKIINTLNEFLIEGIEKNDSKSILIFIYANCYFMINPKWFLNQGKTINLSKRKVSKTIFDLLAKVNFTTSTRGDAPRNEITLLQNYNIGISESNLKKVYDFVNAIERSGRGFHINYILERVCWFMFYLNNRLYLKLINNLSKPEEFIFFFQSLNEKELIKIANTKSITNIWANYEIIRQILKRENRNKTNNFKLRKSIISRLNEIKQYDFEFLKQVISISERSELFNVSLGCFLTKISSLELEEIVEKVFTIDKHSFKGEAKFCLLKDFAKNSNNSQLNHFLKEIYTKWESFFEVQFRDESFYSNQLILTDYSEFIVEYFVELKTDIEVIESVNELLDKISNIDSFWFKNSVNQISHFYLYLSKLYLLSYAFKLKKINTSIKIDFMSIKNDPIIISKFDKDDNLENYLSIINENLSI